MLRRNRRNVPKFQNFDEIIISHENSKSLQLKKKYKNQNPVDTEVQNCSQICGIHITTDNALLASTGINHVEGN